ncbi:MAG: tetratricopeptide repeat protein [Phycisphaerae bacterium]
MRAGWLKLFAKELADKWQIPTFTLAVLLAALAVYNLLALHKRASTEECLRLCEQLIQQKDYTRAGNLAAALLKDTSINPSHQSQVHYLSARIIHDSDLSLEKHSPDRLKAFHRHFSLGVKPPLSIDDHLMLADVNRWENQYSSAVVHLQLALDANAPNRTFLLKQILELLPRTGKNINDEYTQKLTELLARKDLQDEDLVWALDLKTEKLFKEGQFNQAVELLQKTLPRIADENNKLQLQYSLALGQYYQNQTDQAEPTLRDILNRLTTRNELEAKVCLLLGKICAKDDRPEEASAFFDQIIEAHSLTDYHLSALVEKAQTGITLHRFSDAQLRYQEAFTLLERLGPNKLIDQDQILASIQKSADDLSKNNDLDHALSLAHLQYQYLDRDDARANQVLLARIATWHRKLAESLIVQADKIILPELAHKLRKQARRNYENAAEYFLNLSQTPGLLDRTAAQVLWQAALCYEKAGNTDKSRTTLESFLKNWPMDPFLPEGLFKLAKMYQAQNQLAQAEAYYLRLIREFSRTPFGQQSLTLLAECYFYQGPKFYDRAEKILRDMVDDTSNQEQFKPDSSEFRNAMFLLGKLYYYKGEYEPCVGRLEEALERYPNDRSEPQARFLIAQSYRKIADETEEKIAETDNKEIKNVLVRSRQENLQRAQELYRLAIPVFEKMPTRTELEDTYLQLAYVYTADSLYDLNHYDQAIKAYEQVIERYERTPIALDSYLQIANCYQRLGQLGKIKAVLERMKWLLKQIPDQSLAKSGKPFSREDWEKWIEWNYQSGLLNSQAPNFLAGNPGRDPGN